MPLTHEFVAERLELAELLRIGRAQMLQPQDLPGRYGRVVQSLDHVLKSCQCEAVVAGGWAVWRHGYLGRVTQDVDIVVPQDAVENFLQAASAGGFDVLTPSPGRWPKLIHRETQIEVDILPEGGRPGAESRQAPTTIPHPRLMGATPGAIAYIALPALVELKLAAGRLRDEADVVELIRENRDQLEEVKQRLENAHPDYAKRFGELVEQADELEGPVGMV